MIIIRYLEGKEPRQSAEREAAVWRIALSAQACEESHGGTRGRQRE
jgi:hypothetical protein